MTTRYPTDDELIALVKRHARKPGEEFVPQVNYNPAGDSIEFIFADDDYYAERIDGHVTVYQSEVDGTLVGSVLKDVSTWLRRLLEINPSLRIEIQDGHVKLAHFFEAAPADNPALKIVYRRLQKVAERYDAAADLESV